MNKQAIPLRFKRFMGPDPRAGAGTGLKFTMQRLYNGVLTAVKPVFSGRIGGAQVLCRATARTNTGMAAAINGMKWGGVSP
jgi:hypothetical protein